MLARLLCCSREMGAALATPHEGESCDAATVPVAPPTMADVLRERKKKCGGAALGTLRRRLLHAARRPHAARLDRGCEHGRFIRSVVASWRVSDVFLLCDELEARAALRDVTTQAELARPPAPHVHHAARRLACDVEVVGAGWSLRAPRPLLAARSHYFLHLLRQQPGARRLVLSGAAAALSRSQAAAALRGLCADSCPVCDDWDHDKSTEDIPDLDVTNACSCGGGSWRAAAAALQLSPRPLQQDLQRLLETGEFADCRLVFGGEEGPPLEVPCHRSLLMARSRYLRSCLLARSCPSLVVEERVLPRRFVRAVLHAIYTDQVDLSLIGRPTGSPSSTTTNGGTMSWGRGSRGNSTALLEDAFQLYEIAKFLELSIVCQGCEDAIVSMLAPGSLPTVLARSHHAHPFIHRQALRYLRDEFVSVTSSAHVGNIPRDAMLHALASPYTQASEAQVLAGLLRWIDRSPEARRTPPDDDQMQELLQFIRWRHLPPNCDAAKQAVRRGLAAGPLEVGGADAWLARPAAAAPRAFLPHLDQLKALLEQQPVPEAELSRVRRARYIQSIPDTLYMVSARARPPAEAAVVSGAALWALCARAAAVLASPPCARALAPAAATAPDLYTQVALRVVRERALPDACAALVLTELENNRAGRSTDSARSSSPRDEPTLARAGSEGGSLRGLSRRGDGAESSSTSSSYRRDGSTRTLDLAAHRCVGGRLSWRVPDVAMPPSPPGPPAPPAGPPGVGDPPAGGPPASPAPRAAPPHYNEPNANTHLLTVRDYLQQYGGILQLDLGDGAMHTPRPGSRAARASAAGHSRPPRDRHASSSRADDGELGPADVHYRAGVAGRLATLPHQPSPQVRGSSPASLDAHAPIHHLSLSRNSSESSASSSRMTQYRSSSHTEQHL